MQTSEIRPYAWWIKIRNVPSAPVGLVLRHNGTILGRWRSGVTIPLDENDLRSFGFEKCYCPPWTVTAGCPIHEPNHPNVDDSPNSIAVSR